MNDFIQLPDNWFDHEQIIRRGRKIMNETKDLITMNETMKALQEIFSEMKEIHGLMIIDPEDQAAFMPPRTPKKVLKMIAENVERDHEKFTEWENKLLWLMVNLPEDPEPEIYPAKDPVKVPWYKRCFGCEC